MFPLWLGDSTMFLLIPAILFSLYAQYKVQATFRRYAKVPTSRGITGAEMAQIILSRDGAPGVRIEPVAGELSDHYDPRTQALRLSEPVYGSRSIAAVSVAAHEAGHALQHASSYPFLALRSLTVPLANLGSTLAFPIIIFGMFVPAFFPMAINIAILLYVGVVAFTLITLPVEFNASRRALAALERGGHLTPAEMPGARAVLNAAAMTYVAATLSAVLMLVRLLLLRNSRN